MAPVTMTCMTTKQKFEVEDPEVVVLKNGRFAYRAECPTLGKGGRTLTAFKFCSRADHEAYQLKIAAGDNEEPGSPKEESPATD